MLVTIVVPDNIVSVDGRVMPVDCSMLDGNIRVIQWYDTWGTIEFMNEPGKTFKANGVLDSIGGEYQEILDAWQALVDKVDAVPILQQLPVHQAVDVIAQIEANQVLLAAPLGEAADKVRKIQIDGDLDVATLGLDECVRLYDIIQGEPKLLAAYPGVAVKALQAIEADPDLSLLPLADAVDRVLSPVLAEPVVGPTIEGEFTRIGSKGLTPPPPPSLLTTRKS